MSKKTKRIIAWVAIILLASLYITTLVLALMGVSIYSGLFVATIFATFIVPVIAFFIIWLFGR